MPVPRLLPVAAPLYVMIATAPATAQPLGVRGAVDSQPTAAGESISTTGSYRSYSADWLVNPLSELEVGASLRFVTAPESALFADRSGELRFTDVALFRPGARVSFARRFELSGGFDLLAKQPSQLDEPVLQGGDLGLRFGLAKAWALWARGGGGALLNDAGGWGSFALGAQTRKSLHETIRVQAALGGAATRLFMGEDSGRPWFTEVVAHGEALLRTPRGELATWLGVDYRVPLVHDDGNLEIDPKVRLSAHLGFLIGYVKRWDLYLLFSVVDRGDLAEPATTLPVLDGGFDQGQIVIGASRHFDLLSARKKEQILQIIRDRNRDD